MHRARGQDHRNGGEVGADALVGQDEMVIALPHGIFGFGADAVDGAGERAFLRLAVVHLEHAIDLVEAAFEMILHAARYMPVEITGLSSTKTSVCFSSCASTLPRLRKRVFRLITRSSRSGSIGGLVTWLKFCRKIMRQRPVLIGEHGERRVVAHRADGFLAVFHHRMKDQFEVFQREARGDLAAAQFVACRTGAARGRGR